MKNTNEASLEPLSDKEVNDFLERQRRAREDSKWATAKTIKEIKKDTYKICKRSGYCNSASRIRILFAQPYFSLISD